MANTIDTTKAKLPSKCCEGNWQEKRSARNLYDRKAQTSLVLKYFTGKKILNSVCIPYCEKFHRHNKSIDTSKGLYMNLEEMI